MRRSVTLAAAMLMAISGAARAESSPPSWLKKPDIDALRAVWPLSARKGGQGGKALLQCTVTTEGIAIDCKVIEERPAGGGFGAAALILTPGFLFRPAREDGKTVQSRIRIPIEFDLRGVALDVDGLPVNVASWAPWTAAPTIADVRAAYPKQAVQGGLTGHVVMQCEIEPNGALKGCETVAEQPGGRGFGRAAERLSVKFRTVVSGQAALDIRHAQLVINLPIHFEAPSATSTPRYLAQVDWVRTIDSSRAQQLFPAQAAAAKVTKGKAVLDCLILADGALGDCRRESEAPENLGFGDSALMVAKAMRVNLWTRDGQAAPGARIHLPLVLENAEARNPVATKP